MEQMEMIGPIGRRSERSARKGIIWVRGCCRVRGCEECGVAVWLDSNDVKRGDDVLAVNGMLVGKDLS